MFWRSAGLNSFSVAIDGVTAEVNEFLATLPLGDTLDIHYYVGPDATRTSDNMLYMATVIYIEV